MTSWIFVTKREAYPAIDGDWSSHRIDMPWIVRQHESELASAYGDPVYLYLATVGVIARGTIAGPARAKYDLSGWAPEEVGKIASVKLQVPVRVDKWLTNSKVISMASLRADSAMGSGGFVRQNAQGTNFLLSDAEGCGMDELWRRAAAP